MEERIIKAFERINAFNIADDVADARTWRVEYSRIGLSINRIYAFSTACADCKSSNYVPKPNRIVCTYVFH